MCQIVCFFAEYTFLNYLSKNQLLFNDLFGCPINESTIVSATEQCYRLIDYTEEIIRSRTIEQRVVHADETGLRVKGKLQWLHTAKSNLYTYLFVHLNRGEKALCLQQINPWQI